MDIVFRVSQGSILGPVLFKIFLADLFFLVNSTDVANYAHDNTSYATANDIELNNLTRGRLKIFIYLV